MEFLERRLLPVAGRIAEQRHLQAIREGIGLVMPLLIAGSAFLIVACFPVPGYAEAMASWFGPQWQEKLLYPVTATYGVMSILVAFGVACRLAEKYQLDALPPGVVAVAAFLLVTPIRVLPGPGGDPAGGPGPATAGAGAGATGAIPLHWTASGGLFAAILVAVLATEIYRLVDRLATRGDIPIRLPAGAPPAVARSWAALMPGFVVLLAAWLVRLGLEATPFASLPAAASVLLAWPLGSLAGSLPGALLAVLAAQLFWSTGLHGPAIVESVLLPVWLVLMDQNRQAIQTGAEVLPHVVTPQFFQLWVQVGGAGATLAPVLLMLFRARSRQLRDLGRLALGPALFNVNEPVIFGLPIVMNPLLVVPFVVAPLAVTLISYLAMEAGLVARPAGVAVPWTMPIILGGYLATGGRVSGAVLQVVNLVVAGLIYDPFIRAWDRQKLAEERE